MRRRGIRRLRWNRHPFLLPPPLHIILLRHLQEKRSGQGQEAEH